MMRSARAIEIAALLLLVAGAAIPGSVLLPAVAAPLWASTGFRFVPKSFINPQPLPPRAPPKAQIKPQPLPPVAGRATRV